MKRRSFLAVIGTLSLLGAAKWFGVPEFIKPYATELREFIESRKHSLKFLSHKFYKLKEKYIEKYYIYKKKIEQHWGRALISSRFIWVDYADDMSSRTVMDYEHNTLEISIRSSAKDPAAQLKKILAATLSKHRITALEHDPLISTLEDDSNSRDRAIGMTDILMLGINKAKDKVNSLVTRLMNNTAMNQRSDAKGEYMSIKVTLPNSARSNRVQQVLPAVKKYSREFKVSMPLVLAIIHTESAFNPLAQSPIPAFGLMQIVPHSSGLDVQRLVYQNDKPPSAKMLFQPDINIRHGCAYLNILNYSYLKAIKNDAAREHCCIAAYNTGAGNVAKAFSGNTSISAAAKIINTLAADAVYHHLRKKLQHKEARDYVVRVNQLKKVYTL